MKPSIVAWILMPAIGGWVAACRSESTAIRSLSCDQPVVSILPAVPEVAVGDSQVLTAAYIAATDPCNPPLPVSGLHWVSANSTIATIDAVRGVATGVRAGVDTIVIRAPDSTRVLGSALLHVYTPLFNRIIYARLIHSSYPPYPCPAGSGTCPPSLWTMAPDGSDQQLLLDSLNYPESPHVSPDGRTVVFEDWGLLYTVDAAGLNKRQVNTTIQNNYYPSWSPDGQWILFFGYASGGAITQVYLIHPDGTGLRQLTSGPLGGASPAWSPDGGHIVFMQEVLDSLGQLSHWQAAVMDSSGANARVIFTWGCCYTVMGPTWSPDGSTMLFIGPFAPGSSNWGIGRLRLGDSTFTNWLDAQGNRPAEWSPDGSRIVYGAGDLWTMNADGSGQQDVLSNGFINMEASWGPAAPAASSPARARPRGR
jgi:Tol biopolymer transport system component